MEKNFKSELGDDLSKTKLGYYIDEVSKQERVLLNTEFQKIGITLSQFRVLNWLWRKGELTQKEIHELIQIKPSSLTNLLNILIKKELVIRKVDNRDARVKKVGLTNKSKSLEPKAWSIIENYDNKLKNVLSDSEYEITIKSLKKILNSFQV